MAAVTIQDTEVMSSEYLDVLVTWRELKLNDGYFTGRFQNLYRRRTLNLTRFGLGLQIKD